MLIKDDKVILSHKEKEVTERTREIARDALEQRVANESFATGADNGMDPTDPDQRWGRKMDVKDVIQCLLKMNTGLIFEVSNSFPSLMGVYIMDWVPGESLSQGMVYQKKFIMAMENGVMPEFSITYADVIAIPDPKDPYGKVKIKQFKALKRGWRGVLVTLLREGIITAGQVEKHFRVLEGKESRVWHEETGHTQAINVKGDNTNGTGQTAGEATVSTTGTVSTGQLIGVSGS